MRFTLGRDGDETRENRDEEWKKKGAQMEKLPSSVHMSDELYTKGNYVCG